MSSFTNISGGYITPNGNVVMSDGGNGFVTPNGTVILQPRPIIPTPPPKRNGEVILNFTTNL